MSDPLCTVLDALCSVRVNTQDEQQLQEVIADRLANTNLSVERERRLSARDRVDFFCQGVAIEIKTDGTAPAVERQLTRYAEHDEVDALLLVTTRRRHQDMPRELRGKCLTVLYLGGFV